MRPELREARDKLRKATRKEFESMVYDAMLTPLQEEILRLHFCEGVSIGRIAERVGYSESGIRKLFNLAYEKVSKL